MQLVSFTISHYTSTPYERFTDKIIAALAIFQVIEKFDEDDEMEILWIEQNTHIDILVPIYILDRCINPAKGEFRTIQHRITFDTNLKDEHDPTIHRQKTLTENQIQYYLCMAIRRVNNLVMRNCKKYSEEIPIPDLGAEETKDSLGVNFDSV